MDGVDILPRRYLLLYDAQLIYIMGYCGYRRYTFYFTLHMHTFESFLFFVHQVLCCHISHSIELIDFGKYIFFSEN